jgi:hypothetical protein
MAVAGGSVTIDGVDDPFALDVGVLPSLFGGFSDHMLSNDMVEQVHTALHADGITTDGFVTLLFADSGGALSFFALVDDPFGQGSFGQITELLMTSVAPSSSEYWINDVGGDLDSVVTADGMTTLETSYRWNNGAADGMAWSGLAPGDEVAFSFSPLGDGTALSGPLPYQFVTGTQDGWSATRYEGYGDDGSFDFSFTIPVPEPSTLLMAGVLGLVAQRRRRGV